MDTLILEDFRCFAGRHEVPLRPLTLLVGENSTGKTSFLAAANIAKQNVHSFKTPDFNEPPFQLGSFAEIALSGRAREHVAHDFKLGIGVKSIDGFTTSTKYKAVTEASFEFHYVQRDAQPDLSVWAARFGDHSLVINLKKSQLEWWESKKKRQHVPLRLEPLAKPYHFITPDIVRLFEIDEDESRIVEELSRLHSFFPRSAVALAPVRDEPKRTYDLTSDQPKPQGNHVPVVLSQIYGSGEWARIESPLLEFARAARLFERISVKRLGNGEAGPFQLHVKLAGHPRNIIDVGYGVSQVLPVVFDAIRGPKKQLYMFQQPEVHLHPRAQAELATLFGSLVKAQHKQFLVETHSDHLIDRVRMDVRDKKNLRPEDVVILYFEKQKAGVKVHPIFLDERANLLDVPDTYRQFFLDEERRFLGVS